jgi:hypothetical protein
LLDADNESERKASASTVLGAAEGLFRDAVAELEPHATPARRRSVTDLLRACLGGLFLMRAIGAEIDTAAVVAELLAALGVGGSASLEDETPDDRASFSKSI